MFSPAGLALAALCVAAIAGLVKLALLQLRAYRSPLRNIPGPPSASWMFGNFKQVFEHEDFLQHDLWKDEYGPNIRYRGFLGAERLLTFDARALNHILTHSAQYQKPEAARRSLARALGKGVLFTEGEQHRQQRRIMNPAFGPAQIRELTEIFVQKAVELKDVWGAQISMQGEKGPARIDVLSDLTKATLDVIGLAGFNYHFDSLSGKDTELSRALAAMFELPVKVTAGILLRYLFPSINLVFPDSRARKTDDAQKVMRRIGAQLIEEKKAAIRREMAEKRLGMERKDVIGRDLLTLLLKANIATDIPESQRLSDEDVIAQVPTFTVAGHETTSGATSWTLFALTQAPEVQKKLREELLTVQTDNPTMDELSALPYLDAVVRESLRIHAPVARTFRVATEDDVIPVATPFVDRFGQVQDSIRIAKGTMIVVPIAAVNRSKEFWGEDAYEFKPERWESIPQAASEIPGVWAHLLTFLGGPRACIGYRFSLIEMKALLFSLLRAFEFELAVPREEITKKSSVVQRPLLRSAPELGSQMPLLVRPYRAGA